jgi:predicted RNA-binding Zn ribbon-like protein
VIAAPAPTLCLDYCNTRYWRGMDAPTETLSDFAAWRRWLHEARAIDAAAATSLQALHDSAPAAAQQLFADALAVRESMYRLFSAATVDAAPAAQARELAAWLAAAPPRETAVLAGTARGWRVPMAAPSVSELLAPVLWSAADLLLAPGTAPLRCCANPQCRWLFLDTSKGATRRWCAMSACGNRAKVRRHAQRQRARRPD